MDTVLIILGVLGFGAMVISAYVFTVAARNYVSEDDTGVTLKAVPTSTRSLTKRSSRDRRQGIPQIFPITIDGNLVALDRRHIPDRRLAAAG